MPTLRRLRIEKYEGIVILFRAFLNSQTSQDGRLARCLNPKDLSEELYILAANQGHAEAQRRLGYLYQHGIGGVKQNEREAIRWYTKAAQQGNTGAQKQLSAL